MRRSIAFALLLVLAACRPEPKPPDFGLPGFDPNLIEREQAACVERGGRWGTGGVGGRFVCYTDTLDGGQSCTGKSDCEGLCLARSQSCAPVTPLFGCNDVLTSNGQAATICID